MKPKSRHILLLLSAFLLASCQAQVASSSTSSNPEVSSVESPSIASSETTSETTSEEEISSETTEESAEESSVASSEDASMESSEERSSAESSYESSGEESSIEASSKEESSEDSSEQSSEAESSEELSSAEESSEESSVEESSEESSAEESSEESSVEESSEYSSEEQSSEESSAEESSEESSAEESSEYSSEEQSSEELSSEEHSSKESSQSTSSSHQIIDPYGWDVSYSQYGEAFQNRLMSLIQGMNPATTSYSNCLNVGALAAAYPEDSSSTFIPFYHAPKSSEITKVGSCNREHTWPNSRGGGSIEKDPLIIRPTLVSDNSSRGNNFYGLGSNEWDPASCGYEGARGESARVILYAATRYKNLGLTLSNNPKDSASKRTMGTLSTLLEWNNKYQPTDFERHVNERYVKMGYARNPFVDCPEFANFIYDSNGYRTSPYNGGSVTVSSSSSSTYSSSSSVESSLSEDAEYKLVTSTSDLKVGDSVVLANLESSVVAGPYDTNHLESVNSTFSSDGQYITTLGESAMIFTLGYSGGYYTFDNKNSLLGATAIKELSLGEGVTDWSVSFDGTSAIIANKTSSYGRIFYNKSSPRFRNYSSSTALQPVQIYKAM